MWHILCHICGTKPSIKQLTTNRFEKTFRRHYTKKTSPISLRAHTARKFHTHTRTESRMFPQFFINKINNQFESNVNKFLLLIHISNIQIIHPITYNRENKALYNLQEQSAVSRHTLLLLVQNVLCSAESLRNFHIY